LEEFVADGPDELYRELLRMPWEDYIPKDEYLSVHGYVKNEYIRDNRFAFMRVKDAIVDRISDKRGQRPSSGPDLSGAVIYLHWKGSRVSLYMDTSGETIAKHGYRTNPFKAPMMESLAAAVIRASRWQSGEIFVNPMCGSGTLAIEAALMSRGWMPGRFRENYSFMHFIGYDKNKWEGIKNSFQGSSGKASVIIASDHDSSALSAARKNARQAGVESMIRFEKADFSKTPVPDGPGIVILNPEYGERMGVTKSLEDVYTGIGDFLKNRCQGKTGYIFTGNMELAKKVGLRAQKRTPFLNGRIECRLFEYELYQGSRKDRD
jgi:putative N6-adenine-specific DNA methylase